jgi:hypothetical protein
MLGFTRSALRVYKNLLCVAKIRVEATSFTADI